MVHSAAGVPDENRAWPQYAGPINLFVASAAEVTTLAQRALSFARPERLAMIIHAAQSALTHRAVTPLPLADHEREHFRTELFRADRIVRVSTGGFVVNDEVWYSDRAVAALGLQGLAQRGIIPGGPLTAAISRPAGSNYDSDMSD